MTRKIEESDWKHFCKIKEIAKERFSTNSILDYKEALENDATSALEKHTMIYRLSENRNKHYELLFSEHRRSRMALQLLAIRGEKLVDDDLVKQLTPEMQDRTDPKAINW